MIAIYLCLAIVLISALLFFTLPADAAKWMFWPFFAGVLGMMIAAKVQGLV